MNARRYTNSIAERLRRTSHWPRDRSPWTFHSSRNVRSTDRLCSCACAVLVLSWMTIDLRGQDSLDVRPRWWLSGAIQQTLQLTPAQVHQLDKAFEHGRPDRMKLRHKLAQMDRLLHRIM